MFQRLRFQLTVLFAAVTAIVLISLTSVCLISVASDTENQETAAFSANVSTLLRTLEQQAVISHSALKETEAVCDLRVRVLSDGEPLYFQTLSEDADTSRLLTLAEEEARTRTGIDIRAERTTRALIDSQVFSLKTSGIPCAAAAAIIPRNGGTIGVIAVHVMTTARNRIYSTAVRFVLADFLALFLLTVFFRALLSRMLRPLQENRRKQTEFIAAASHELRSPLTVVRSQVDAVRDGSMPADETFLKCLDEESSRMSRLVGDMLSLAAADNHSLSLSYADTEPDTLLMELYEAYEPMAAAQEITWSIRLPDGRIPALRCDPDRIRQLLSALIDNAIGVTPPGGTVTLSLSAAPADLRFAVADSGPGIPDTQKEAVFDRFHKLDKSRGDKQHFGLGLSVAREIADLHGGRILVTDTPGGGATFVLVLPLTPPQSRTPRGQ